MSGEWLYLLASIASTAIYILIISYVYGRCFERRFSTKWQYITVYSIVFIALIATDFVNWGIQYIAIYHIACIAIPTILYQSKLQSKILLPIFIFIVGMLAESIVALQSGYYSQSFLTESPSSLLAFIITYSLSKALLFILISLIPLVIPKQSLAHFPVSHWVAIMATPIGSYFVAYFFLMNALNTGTIDKPIIAIFYLFLFFNIYTLFIFGKISRDYDEIVNTKLRANQYQFYAQQYDKIIPSYVELSEYRHEMKNNIIAARNYLLNNDYASTLELTDKLLGLTADSSDNIEQAQSGNVLFDTIINFKSHEAYEKGVRLTANIKVPSKITLDAYDLSAILGNAIDNSIEACLKNDIGQRIITCNIFLRNTQLCIIVENPFYGEIITNDKDELLSSKVEPRLSGHTHGLGLNVITHIVKSYDGTCSYTLDNDIFVLMVLLSLEGKSNINEIITKEVIV